MVTNEFVRKTLEEEKERLLHRAKCITKEIDALEKEVDAQIEALEEAKAELVDAIEDCRDTLDAITEIDELLYEEA